MGNSMSYLVEMNSPTPKNKKPTYGSFVPKDNRLIGPLLARTKVRASAKFWANNLTVLYDSFSFECLLFLKENVMKKIVRRLNFMVVSSN